MNPSDRERMRLDAVTETGLLDVEQVPALKRAARLVKTALDAPVALVTLVDDRRQYFAGHAGAEALWGPIRETPLSQSYCRYVVSSEDRIIVPDATQHVIFRDHPGHTELGIVAYAGVPIRTSDGFVVGALCAIDTRPRSWSARDLAILVDSVQWVSEEIDLRRKLARAQASSRHLANLHDNLRAAQELTASSARATLHDLRSPLTALGIGLDQLVNIVEDPPVARLVEMLHRNLSYIGSLVDEASEEMGVGPVRVIDAAQIAADIADHVTVPEGVALRLQVACDPAPVRFGRVLLRRCMVNLTDNALRFARRAVELSQDREGDEIVTRVDDDGPGLPTLADYQRIGEPHLRLHAREGCSGSGLGLSIAAKLLGDHGGVLRGEPSPLGGARLEMRLPLADLPDG